MIRVYTDGSYMPGKEIYSIGVVIIYQSGFVRRISQYYKSKPGICSNYAELIAVLEAFRTLIREEHNIKDVSITTDSMFVVNALRKQETKKYKEELLEVLELAKNFESLTVRWTKGHKGHPHNELCDALSTLAIRLFDSKNNIDKENEDAEEYKIRITNHAGSVCNRDPDSDTSERSSCGDSEGTFAYPETTDLCEQSSRCCYEYCEYCERDYQEGCLQRDCEGGSPEEGNSTTTTAQEDI